VQAGVEALLVCPAAHAVHRTQAVADSVPVTEPTTLDARADHGTARHCLAARVVQSRPLPADTRVLVVEPCLAHPQQLFRHSAPADDSLGAWAQCSIAWRTTAWSRTRRALWHPAEHTLRGPTTRLSAAGPSGRQPVSGSAGVPQSLAYITIPTPACVPCRVGSG
jgi:hypothetical protein